MSVNDLRALCREIQHATLRRIEPVTFSPVTATVFAMASKNRREELRGKLLDVAHEGSLLLFYIAFVFVAQALLDQTPDASFQNAVRDEIALDQRFVAGWRGL